MTLRIDIEYLDIVKDSPIPFFSTAPVMIPPKIGDLTPSLTASINPWVPEKRICLTEQKLKKNYITTHKVMIKSRDKTMADEFMYNHPQ